MSKRTNPPQKKKEETKQKVDWTQKRKRKKGTQTFSKRLRATSLHSEAQGQERNLLVKGWAYAWDNFRLGNYQQPLWTNRYGQISDLERQAKISSSKMERQYNQGIEWLWASDKLSLEFRLYYLLKMCSAIIFTILCSLFVIWLDG